MRTPKFSVGFETQYKTLVSEVGREVGSGAVLYMWRCKTCGRNYGPSSGSKIMGTARTKCCPLQKGEKRNYLGRGMITGDRFAQYKANARRRGVLFTLPDAQHLVDIWNEQDGLCAYTGEPLTLGSGNASIDRKDPTKGYEIGNVHWVLTSVNTMKGTLTDEKFIQLCSLITERRNGDNNDTD